MILSEVFRGRVNTQKETAHTPELLLVHRELYQKIEQELYEKDHRFMDGFKELVIEGMKVIIDPVVPPWELWFTWKSEWTPPDEPAVRRGERPEMRYIPPKIGGLARAISDGSIPPIEEPIKYQTYTIQPGQRLIETPIARVHKHSVRGVEERRRREEDEARRAAEERKAEAARMAEERRQRVLRQSHELGDSAERIAKILERKKGIDYLLEELD